MKNNAKRNKKFVLTLNSHSLSDYQRCPEIYKYSSIVKIEPNAPYYPFVKGAIISKVLELWYRGKKLAYGEKKLKALEFKLFKILWNHSHLKEWHNAKGVLLNDDKQDIAMRMRMYFHKYRDLDEPKNIVAVEKGFSKVLYESDNVYFVYEGRPDLIVNSENGLMFIDHKSESRESDIFKYNNQFMGYCWGTETNHGLINYIGLQTDDKKGNVLRRVPIHFSNDVIKQWHADTVHTYFLIMQSIVNKRFLRTWQCSGKYGNCIYTNLCTNPELNGHIRNDHIKRLYKTRKIYQSW